MLNFCKINLKSSRSLLSKVSVADLIAIQTSVCQPTVQFKVLQNNLKPSRSFKCTVPEFHLIVFKRLSASPFQENGSSVLLGTLRNLAKSSSTLPEIDTCEYPESATNSTSSENTQANSIFIPFIDIKTAIIYQNNEMSEKSST